MDVARIAGGLEMGSDDKVRWTSVWGKTIPKHYSIKGVNSSSSSSTTLDQ